MKTLLCVIVLVGLAAMPLLAQEAPKVDFTGSRLAVGYIDAGKGKPGTFEVADAKLNTNVKLDNDATATIRLDLNGGVANGADNAFIKLTNVVNRLASTNSPVNPVITVGKFKLDFGEETYSSDVVNNAGVLPSLANVGGNETGIMFKQDDLVKSLPFVLCASFTILNADSAATDSNNAKGTALKASGTMKSMPLYFSLSTYSSSKEAPGSLSALTVEGNNGSVYTTKWDRKIVELDVRYDLLEGAQKFDPSKAPLWSDAKGIFRFAYGQATDGNAVVDSKITTGYIILDGVYNIDKKWYAAFRYSSTNAKFGSATNIGMTDPGAASRIAIAGGNRLSENTMIKAEYATNKLAKNAVTGVAPKSGNDNQISLVFTAKW